MPGTVTEAARVEAGTTNPGFKGEVRRIEIGGAFHTDILSKASGRRAVVEFLRGDGGDEGLEKG